MHSFPSLMEKTFTRFSLWGTPATEGRLGRDVDLHLPCNHSLSPSGALYWGGEETQGSWSANGIQTFRRQHLFYWEGQREPEHPWFILSLSSIVENQDNVNHTDVASGDPVSQWHSHEDPRSPDSPLLYLFTPPLPLPSTSQSAQYKFVGRKKMVFILN